jgi:hypothetical protein
MFSVVSLLSLPTLRSILRSPTVFRGVHVAQSLVFCLVFCRLIVRPVLLFLLAIILSAPLLFTAPDYPFGIFKLLKKGAVFTSSFHVLNIRWMKCEGNLFKTTKQSY